MKNQEQIEDFNLKLEARIKDGVKLASKAAKLAEAFGVPSDDGFKFNLHNSTFNVLYDTLNTNLFVDAGTKYLFKANIKAKTVSVFRNGAWISAISNEYEKKFASTMDKEFVNINSGLLEELMGIK